MYKDKRFRWSWYSCQFTIRIFVLSLLFVICSCAGRSIFHPYATDFKCPPGYNGICETIEDAYYDSLYGIDPRLYDSNWIKQKKKWEEKHQKLLKVREKLGYYKSVDERIKEIEKRMNKALDYGVDPGNVYKIELFRTLSSLLKEPQAPLLVPPKVIRILVLSTLGSDEKDKTIYVSPHYTYFILDEPKWLLHKIPEDIPFGEINPLIK